MLVLGIRRAKIESRKTKVQSYYFDMKLQAAYWAIGVDKRKWGVANSKVGWSSFETFFPILPQVPLHTGGEHHICPERSAFSTGRRSTLVPVLHVVVWEILIQSCES